MIDFKGAAEPLSRAGLSGVLDELKVGVAELLALLAVESKGCGFLPDRRPIILFERHVFHKRTRGRHDAGHPGISNSVPGGYAGLAREYPRLEEAMALDRTAALMSASWGAGQVMGFNHEAAGFADVETMVQAMHESETAQLAAVASFLTANRMVPLLRAKDWSALARAYNGPSFAKNKYDVRLAGAFELYASGAFPDIEVRRSQLYLTYLGFAPGAVDGLHGKFSRSAVAQFRAAEGLGSGERVDRALVDAMQSKVAALVQRA